ANSEEYPVVFRLAEQYLIRAEARAELGKISEAQSDLNVIRNRAGLGNTTASTKEALRDAILDERQVELFTERGHRWFDLKRRGEAADVLAPLKPSWQDTDVLFPIPESELLLNPNLLPQNDGY
ncbi:RagB/SusD family nutrient uptake outer membrane protein, partial [Flavivirga aquimarina]